MGRGHVWRVVLVGSVLLGALGAATPARAAEGDPVTAIFAPEAAPGVGVAFDGSILYYTNFGDPFLHRITPAGTPLAPILIIGAGEGVNAISYDATRDMFWGAGKDGRTVYLIDKLGIAVLQFAVVDLVHLPGECDNGTPEGGPGFCELIIDGLAFDGTATDQSVWFSPDGSHRVYHYGTDGTLLGFYDINEPGESMAPDCPNYSSGVVVAKRDQPTGRVIHYDFAGGCVNWFRYLASDTNDPVRQAVFPTYDGPRAEDGECDDVTFGFSVVWVRDEEDPFLRAFQADCIVGGGEEVPHDKDRMTGGGGLPITEPLASSGKDAHHGFMLHCFADVRPNHLQVNWDGNRFHMTQLDEVACSDSPVNPNPPEAGFDTIEGRGHGRYNGRNGATVEFRFTDAGEPGSSDSGRIVVRDQYGNVVLVAGGFLLTGKLAGEGNYQAHDAQPAGSQPL